MIRVFSSFAQDIITYQNNKTIIGGPATWIKQSFDSLNVDYQLYTGPKPGVVKIDKDGNGEDRGTIVSTEDIPFILPSPEDILLISTLRQEFNLQNIISLENTICIDIQGFLRGDGGKKQRFDCRRIVTAGQVIIKATRQEFSYLDYHDNVKHIFIITNGGGEIEIFGENIDFSIPIIYGKFNDTIGAGDTFFSAFVAFYERTNDIRSAINEASYYAYQFLSEKNSNFIL